MSIYKFTAKVRIKTEANSEREAIKQFENLFKDYEQANISYDWFSKFEQENCLNCNSSMFHKTKSAKFCSYNCKSDYHNKLRRSTTLDKLKDKYKLNT